MTTQWQVPRMWEGKTVAVLAAGPSLTQEQADGVKKLPRIAVNRAVKFAPDADMFGAIDPRFHEGMDDFAGLRVCGIECHQGLLYLPMAHEVVTMAPGHVVHIRNNALFAMRIAALACASKLLLLGFDSERYDAIHAGIGFMGFTAGLAALIAELRAQGIEVERIGAE